MANPTFQQPNGFTVTAVPIGKGIGNQGNWNPWDPTDLSEGVDLSLEKLQQMPVDAHECEGYTETVSEHGRETSRLFQMPWSQVALFMQWAYGYSFTKLISTDPPKFRLYRSLPCQDWYYPSLYCAEANLKTGAGKYVPDPRKFFPDKDPTGKTMIIPAAVYADNLGMGNLADGGATVEVKYRARPYPVRNDADAEAHALGERSRWVQVRRTYAIQALPLAKVAIADTKGGRTLKFINGIFAGDIIPEAGVVLMPTQTFEVTWWEVPFDPDPGIRACMGRVNANPFTIAPDWGPFPEETLLCQAPETVGPFRNAASALCWHVKFRLDYRQLNQAVPIRPGLPAGGWNYFYAGDGYAYKATFGGDPAGPTVFQTVDFSQLFDIQGPPVW
jgi:hypothetical protein